VHQISLHWPQEVARMVLVELISSLEGVVVGGYKWWWVRVECRQVIEWIANDFALYAELLGKFSNHWANLFGDRLVFLFGG
jgi:hypothetical protein